MHEFLNDSSYVECLIISTYDAGGRYFVYGLVDSDKLKFQDEFEVQIKAHFSDGGQKTIPITVTAKDNSRTGSMIHKVSIVGD